MRDKNQLFTVSLTYDVVTPESAEFGDYDESGFVWSEVPMSFREVAREIENHGAFENLQQAYGSQSLYFIDPERDYRDGSETTYALHISGPKRAMKRLVKILSKKS